MDHLAFFDSAGRQFPHLLYANAVDLRVEPFLQVVSGDQLFRQRAARPFRQHRDLRLHVIAGLKVRFFLAMLVHAFVIGANAYDVIAFNKKLCSGKSGKNRDAGLLTFSPSHFTKRLMEIT